MSAPSYARPTLIFVVVSTAVMIASSIAISKIPKNQRKGFTFGLVVLQLVLAIVSMMYNFWLYAKETGMANSAKAQGAALFSKMQAKISGGGAPAGATNVGAVPAV